MRIYPSLLMVVTLLSIAPMVHAAGPQPRPEGWQEIPVQLGEFPYLITAMKKKGLFSKEQTEALNKAQQEWKPIAQEIHHDYVQLGKKRRQLLTRTDKPDISEDVANIEAHQKRILDYALARDRFFQAQIAILTPEQRAMLAGPEVNGLRPEKMFGRVPKGNFPKGPRILEVENLLRGVTLSDDQQTSLDQVLAQTETQRQALIAAENVRKVAIEPALFRAHLQGDLELAAALHKIERAQSAAIFILQAHAVQKAANLLTDQHRGAIQEQQAAKVKRAAERADEQRTTPR